MASSLTKEAGGSSTVGTNRVCSDERNRENECSYSTSQSKDRNFSIKPICHEYRLWEQELL